MSIAPPRAPTRAAPAKVGPPRLARTIERPRLLAALDALAGRPLAWIAGPPGSGKTTLAASWLRTQPGASAWLHVDAADSDPATFFHWLTLAMQNLAGKRALRLPALSADDLRDPAGVARRLVRSLAERLDGGWTLVLDNVHELSAESPVHAAIAAALAEVPADARLLAIGREQPGDAFAKARAAQWVGIVDADAMRFTVDETRAMVGLHGGAIAADALHAATDGWAAGQILMLAAGTPLADVGGSRESVFAYFAGEVLERIEPRLRTALMKLAVLPAVGERVAQTLSGEPGAGRLLVELHRRNLFVGRRAQKDPVYVFHALFREFLLARLDGEVEPAARRAVRRRAAEWMRAEGQADTALKLLLDADEPDDAMALLDARAAEWLRQGRAQVVRDSLAALPAALRGQPRGLYWTACCALESRPADAGLTFERAWRGFADADDAIGQLLAAAGAAESIVMRAAGFAALDRWIEVFETLAPSYFAIQDPDVELRVLPGMLAAFVARRAEHPLTTLLSDRAELLLEREEAASHRLLLGSVAWCFLDVGQHERVARLLRNLDRLRASQPISPATDLRWRHVEVIWKTLVGRLDEALADAQDAERIGDGAGIEHLRAATRVMAAQAAWCAGAGATARRYLESARPSIPPSRTLDRCVLVFITGMVALSEGDARGALPSLRDALALARETGSPARERIASFALALAETEAGDHDAAEAALARAKTDPVFGQVRFHRWVVAMVEANLAQRRGDDARCLRALREGFGLAREGGYCYAPTPFSSPGLMARLCMTALRHDIEVAHVRHLIRDRRLRAPPGADEAWPWRVRIHALGRLRIEVDDAPLPSPRKAQRKPLDLLRLVIAAGPGGLAARQAMHALWPDADGDDAQHSFDNTLLRLRRLVGDDRFVVLGDGTLTLDPALCWVDAYALDAACDGIERALRADDDGDDQVERVLRLQRGPLLDGDDELAPVLLARERLRARFLRQTTAVAERAAARGDVDRAIPLLGRILEQDLLAEDAARRLIRCLVTVGRRAEAWEVYRRLRDRLSIVLGIRPAPETEALAATLREPSASPLADR